MSEDPKKLKGFRIEDMKIGDTGIGEKPLEDLGLTEDDRTILNILKESSKTYEMVGSVTSIYKNRFSLGDNPDEAPKRIEKFEKMGLIMKLKPRHYYFKDRFVGFYNRHNDDYYSFAKDVKEKNPPNQLSVYNDSRQIDIDKLKVAVPDLEGLLANSKYPIGSIIMNLFMCEGFYLDDKKALLGFLKENKDKYGLCIADKDIGNLKKDDLCSKSYYDSLIAETSGADAVDQKKGVGGFLEAQSGEGEDGVKPIVEVETTAPTSPAVATELEDPFGNLDVPVVSKPLADPFGNLDVPSLGVGNIEGKESVQFERKKERLIEVLEYKTISDKKGYLQSVRDQMVESNIDKYLLDSKANEFLSVDEVSYIQDSSESVLDTYEKIQEKANEIWYSKIRNLEYVFLVRTATECDLSITDAKKCLDLLVKDGQLLKSNRTFGKYNIKKDAKEKSGEVIDLDKIKSNFEELKKTNKKISDVDISGLEDINSIKDYLRGLVEGDQISPFDFIDIVSSGYSQVGSKLEEIKKHLSESVCKGRNIYQDLNKIRNIKGNINAMSVCQALELKAELFSKYAQAIVDKINKEKSSVLDGKEGVADSSASGAGASESAPVAGAVGGNTPENLVGTEDVIDLDKLVEDLEKRALDDFQKGDLEQIQLQQYLHFKRKDPLLGRKSSLDDGPDPVFEKMKEKGMLFKDNSNLIAYWNSKKGKICYCSIGSEMLKSVHEKLLSIKKDLPKVEDVVGVAIKKIGGEGWLDIEFILESIFESLNRDQDISLSVDAKYFIDIQESLMKKNIASKADFDSDKFGIKSGRVYSKKYLDNIKKKIKESDKDEGKEKPKEDKPDSAVESDPLAKELDKAREKYAKLRAEYDYVNASHIRKYLELREWVKGKARSTKKFENSQRFAPVDLPEKAKSSELMEAENAYKKALLEYRKNILEKQKTTDGVLKKSEFEVRKGKLVDITDEDEAKTAGKSKKENVEKVSINMALLDDAVLESEKLFALRMKNKPPIFGERIARLRSFLAEHKYKRILLTGTIIGMGTLVAGATPMMALGAGAVRVARGLGTIGVASGAGAITAKFLDSRRKNDSKLNFGEALSGKEEIDDDLMTTLNEISEKQMEKMKKDRKWATRAAFLAGGAFALGSTLYTSPAYASEVNTRTGAEDTNSVPRNVVGVKLADTRPWYKFWDKGEPRPIQQQDNSSADSTLNQRPTSTGTTGAVDQASKGPTGPTGQTGTSGAGALNQQPPKVETPVPDISTAPLKTEFSSLGSIQTLKDLKANIGQIPDDGKYVAIKNFLSGKTPEQLSKDLGLWKPNGQSGESAMFRQGDSLYIDSKGQLVVNKGGVGTVLFDNKGQIHKYGGEMFHAQMPKASVRLEPTRPFVEPKPKVGQEYLGDDSVGRVYYYDDKGVKHYNDEFMIDNEIPSDKVTPLSDSIEGHPNDYIIKDNTSTPSSEIIKENIDSIKPPSGFDQPVDENGNGFIRYNGDKVVAILDGNKNEISTIKNGHIELKDNLQFGSSSEQLASRLQYNTAISKLRSEGKISPIVTDIPYKPFKNSQFSVEEVVRGQEKTFDVLLNGKKITSFEGTDGVDGKGKLVLEFNKELPRRNGWFIFSHKSDWYKAFEYFRDQAVSYTKDGVKIGNKTFRVASGK